MKAASFEKERARRKRLDGIIGDPHQRFGFDPWQHPEPSGGAGIQHLPPRELKVAMGGVCSDIGGGGHDAPLDRRGRNGGEHFLQAKASARQLVTYDRSSCSLYHSMMAVGSI